LFAMDRKKFVEAEHRDKVVDAYTAQVVYEN
jgi:hypothetical protein